MEKLVLNVEGMHCGSCEMLVKTALEDLPGVQEAVANHSENKVEITFDENAADTTQFGPAIEGEGFKVVE